LELPLAKSIIAANDPPPAYIRSLRPTYPYSVIPGGAYSPQELRHANDTDGIVRAHYADFNLNDAWVVKLIADRYQYVSYRLHNQVYWTAKKLRIPQGEYLLTDGVHFARARCGNRLSDQPLAQISSLEPPPAELSRPAFRPNQSGTLDLDQTPASPLETQTDPNSPPFLPSDSTSMALLERSPELQIGSPLVPVGPPPFIVLAGGTRGPSSPDLSNVPVTPIPPVAPSPVPEPSTIYLFLITFAVVLFALTRLMAAGEKTDAE
jgi:hypothetical protein